jgi:acetyl esterase/lipase
MRHPLVSMPGFGWTLAACLLLSTAMTTTGTATGAETYHDVEFSRAGGTDLLLDASIPDGQGPFAAAILVHGGGWVRGDRKIDVAPLFKPLSDAGIAWFTIDYRLAADPLRFGVAVNDVEAAVQFVKEHAAEYRIDPDRIALIGESAGGHLAALAALNGRITVKAVVALYAPTNLVSLVKDSDLIPDSIRSQLQGTAVEGLIMARLAQLSPILKVHAGMPPFLLIHGTADVIVPFDQSRAMCDKIKSVGGDCQLFAVPRAGHGMRRWEGNPSMAGPYKREMIKWLREQLSLNPVTLL